MSSSSSVAFAPVPPRILIAEDDVASAELLKLIFRDTGYQVTVKDDGSSAMSDLEERGAPDVLLLDWMLPEVSGLEVCRWVRERWDELALPVLMVTARTDPESISAAYEAGASDYITKPYLAAELKRRIAAHLRVKRLIEERERMDEHLREREKLSSLGLLVSGVAHELNNPLSGISGYAQLLLLEEEDAEKVEDLRQILSEVERCRTLIADLLSFARRHPTEHAEVDVAAVLQSTFDLRSRDLRGSGVNATLHTEPDLPRVLASTHQLQQVFLNILLNAEQALSSSQGGSIRLTAHRAPAAEVNTERAAEWVAIDFFNNGPPIHPDALPHIFDPFYTTKPTDEGTGLGLTVCRRIVEEHGGEVRVESRQAGTTFRVLLPGK